MKIHRYISLNIIAFISLLQMILTIINFGTIPFFHSFKYTSPLLKDIFEEICNYKLYKFEISKDYYIEILILLFFIAFICELIYRHKYPNKLKEIIIQNKTLNFIYLIFFYSSYIYILYITVIYLVYLLFLLFVYIITLPYNQ